MCYNPVVMRTPETRLQEAQRTLARPVRASGIGLHTGELVGLELLPAPEGTGIVFEVLGQGQIERIPALAEYVVETRRGTTLGIGETRLATVEHLMAAFWGAGVDNCLVRVQGTEIPVMDGSALPFLELIEGAGLVKQEASRKLLRLSEPLEVRTGEAFIRLEPALTASFEYRFESPLAWLGAVEASYRPCEASFGQQVAPARTFGLESEAKALIESGLARGASLENVLVLGEEGYVNEPRLANEVAAHKLLDLVGDLYLTGAFVEARVTASRSGHTLHTQAALALRNQTGMGGQE